MRPIAAVTGGTGFLGRYFVDALLAAGWHVRVLVRRVPSRPMPSTVELVPGDLGDADALSRLVEGASAVVHAAGLVKALGLADFLAVNRDGTARLAAIVARLAPQARFMLISSQAARAPGLSPYAASKRAAEDATANALPATSWVILRPCVVYGPWDVEGIALLHLVSSPLVLVPVAPEPRIAMIHARDVAAVVVALCRPGPSGTIYEISDACVNGHPWREVVTVAARLLGRVPRFLPVPDPVLLAAGAVADGWAALTRRPSLFGRGKVHEILHRDWSSDPTLQPPQTVWTPTVGLADGLRETIAWWRNDRPPGTAALHAPAELATSPEHHAAALDSSAR